MSLLNHHRVRPPQLYNKRLQQLLEPTMEAAVAAFSGEYERTDQVIDLVEVRGLGREGDLGTRNSPILLVPGCVAAQSPSTNQHKLNPMTTTIRARKCLLWGRCTRR